MPKIFKVTAAPGPEGPKSIEAALDTAKETGVLAVPQEAIMLTVDSGLVIEADHERK
jgi:hypothetical protein